MGLWIWCLCEHLTMAQQHQASLVLPEPEVKVDPGLPRFMKPSPVSAWSELWPALTAATEDAQQDPYAARRLFNFIVGRRADVKHIHNVRNTFEDLGISTNFPWWHCKLREENHEDSVFHPLMVAESRRSPALSHTRLTITASGCGCP